MLDINAHNPSRKYSINSDLLPSYSTTLQTITMSTSRNRSLSSVSKSAPSLVSFFWFFCVTSCCSVRMIDAFSFSARTSSSRVIVRQTATSPLFYQQSEDDSNLLRPYSDNDESASVREQYFSEDDDDDDPRTDQQELSATVVAEAVRREWVDRSMSYYSKIMREERRRNLGQIRPEDLESQEYHEAFAALAKKHYFALVKAKNNQPQHAERIYKRIIDELLTENDEEECDHAKLAVTTLLLALHVQRSGGEPKKTRSVFLRFFRLVNERSERCACSAKVLIAFALFEMKQGNSLKSLEIVLKAIKLDPTVRPVLNWKQFRDSMERRRLRQMRSREQRRLLKQRLE